MNPTPTSATANAVIIYLRFSPRPKKNGNNGSEPTLDVQFEACVNWCAMHHATIEGRYEDKYASGREMHKREGLKAALAHVCSIRGSTLLAFSMSRWSRSIVDNIAIAQKLKRAGCQLMSVTEHIDTSTPFGRASYHMMAVWAELERDTTAYRTSISMKSHQDHGRRMTRIGKIRYGWRIDPADSKRLVEDPHEQEVIVIIKFLHGRENGLRAICRQLERDGIEPREGAKWAHTVVKSVLQREGVLG